MIKPSSLTRTIAETANLWQSNFHTREEGQRPLAINATGNQEWPKLMRRVTNAHEDSLTPTANSTRLKMFRPIVQPIARNLACVKTCTARVGLSSRLRLSRSTTSKWRPTGPIWELTRNKTTKWFKTTKSGWAEAIKLRTKKLIINFKASPKFKSFSRLRKSMLIKNKTLKANSIQKTKKRARTVSTMAATLIRTPKEVMSPRFRPARRPTSRSR